MRKSLGGLFIGRETAAGGCHAFFASRPSRDETERQLPQTGAAIGCEFSCVGRPPAEMPDGDAALEGLTAFLARFCKILNPLFDGIRKARDMERCLYEGRTFLWTFIVGHLARLGSRNAMDANRNMTQRKWVEVIFQKLLARGIALALDELPRRYVSREFLTL